MNRQLLDILFETNKVDLNREEKHIVEFFVEYMDHSSLWLLGVEHSSEPVFIFTNEAQRFRFTLSEIKTHYKNMKSGIALDWTTIPFEYTSNN
jgi:hypothetical protein